MRLTWALAVLSGVAVLLWPALPLAAASVLPSPARRPPVGSQPPRNRSTFSRPLRLRSALTRRRARSRAGRASCDAAVLRLLDGLAAGLRAGLSAAEALEVARPDGLMGGAAPEADAGHGASADAAVSDERWAQDMWPVRGWSPSQWAATVRRITTEARDGGPVGGLWLAGADRLDSSAMRLFARAWCLSEDVGAPLSAAAETAADLVRTTTEQERRLAAALAGPRATMRILTVLPLAGPLLALLVGVPLSRLFDGPLPLLSAAAGGVLLVIGRAWVARMIHVTQRGPVLR